MSRRSANHKLIHFVDVSKACEDLGYPTSVDENGDTIYRTLIPPPPKKPHKPLTHPSNLHHAPFPQPS